MGVGESLEEYAVAHVWVQMAVPALSLPVVHVRGCV